MIGSSVADCVQGVLVVDDEEKACKWFARRYGDEFAVLTAGGVAEALTILLERGSGIAVLLSDYRMPDQCGIDLLETARLSYPHVVRVLMSAHADKEAALLAVNRGRAEQIPEKPLDEVLTRPDARLTAADLVRALQLDYPFDAHERGHVQTELGEDFAVPARQGDLLYLVLCTLLGNALQAQRGQTVPVPRIHVRLSRRPHPELRVTDNGPGLPAHLAHRLAREPMTSTSGGTGMGLLFCRRVMAAIGGDIILSNAEGGAATVVLRFPETTTLENAF